MSAPLLGAVDVAIWLPTPGAAFTLDVNRLSPYTPAQPGLGSPTSSGAWTSVLGDALSVQIRRGGARPYYAGQAEVGTLSLTMRNRPDLVLSTRLRPGLPIRASIPGGAPLFTGTILDIDTRVALEPLTGKQILTTTITAVDAIQQLANTTRYGAKSADETGYRAESWEARIRRLMASAGNIPYEIDSSGAAFGGATHASTELETSLAAFLDVTANTVGAALWCVRADGVVQFRASSYFPPGAGRPRFTDGTTGTGTSTPYPYLSIGYDYGTKDLVTGVTFNRHYWHTVRKEFVSDTVTFSDDTLAATYGRRSAIVDVTRQVVDSLAGRIIGAARAGRANVRSVTVNARTNPVLVAAVDITHAVYVRIPAPISAWQWFTVTGIEHDITPGRWTTTYQLARSF
jgi:hypothetical protein